MTPPSRVRVHAAWIAGIVLAVLAAYAGSFDGDYVSDDLQGVRDNPLLRSPGLAELRAIGTTFQDANYIPVSVLSLALDRRLWGPAPTGHHVTNVLLHAACAVAIFSILLRLGALPAAAGLVALLWALHPLQVESVAWISERKNVLSGLFFFAAFRVWLRHVERGSAATYAGLLVLYVLALLSKMNTMVLPALCLAHAAVWRRQVRRRDLLVIGPMLAAAALVGWYNLAGNPIHARSYHGGSPWVTWLSSAVVFFRYLGQVALPLDLRPWYDVPLRGSLAEPRVLLAVLGVVTFAGITAWLGWHRRREAFWLLWFAIALAPMLNIVPFRSLMQDRYVYLALLGPLALSADLLSQRSVAVRKGAVVAAAVVAALYGALTVRQVEVWANPVSLWAAGSRTPIVAADPPFRDPRHDGQEAHVRQALARDPGSATLHNNFGALLYQVNRIGEAVGELETAARLQPDQPFILLNLGRAYVLAGRLAEGRTALERAVALRPYDSITHGYLFRAYVRSGDAVRARREYDAMLRLDPSSPTRSCGGASIRRCSAWRRRGRRVERARARSPASRRAVHDLLRRAQASDGGRRSTPELARP